MSIDLQTATLTAMTVINEDGTHMWKQHLLSSQKMKLQEEVVEQTAEQTVEKQRVFQKKKKNNEERLKKRFRQNQSHSSIIKKQTVINQKYISQNYKTCHLNGGRQKGRRDTNIFRLHPFPGKDNDFKKKS